MQPHRITSKTTAMLSPYDVGPISDEKWADDEISQVWEACLLMWVMS